MRPHLPALDHGRMDPAPARYMIRINGHLGATMLSAFPALAPQHHGAHTVLTGLLDQSALYGVLAEIEAFGLDLLELRKLTPDRELPETGHHYQMDHLPASRRFWPSPRSGDPGAAWRPLPVLRRPRTRAVRRRR